MYQEQNEPTPKPELKSDTDLAVRKEDALEESEIGKAVTAYGVVKTLLEKYPDKFTVVGVKDDDASWLGLDTWVVVTKTSSQGEVKTKYNLSLMLDKRFSKTDEEITFSQPQPHFSSNSSRNSECKITYIDLDDESERTASTMDIPGKGLTDIKISQLPPVMPVGEMLDLLNRIGNEDVSIEVGSKSLNSLTYEEHLERRTAKPALGE